VVADGLGTAPAAVAWDYRRFTIEQVGHVECQSPFCTTCHITVIPELQVGVVARRNAQRIDMLTFYPGGTGASVLVQRVGYVSLLQLHTERSNTVVHRRDCGQIGCCQPACLIQWLST